jgi:ATP-dependent DNA ligase
MNEIFEQLAATSSRLEKEAILKKHQDNELLKDAIKLALDPYIQFYIRKIPDYTISDEPKATLEKAFTVGLPRLYRRVVTGNLAISTLKHILEHLTESDAKVVERIIQKDLRCGVSEATVNKIWPGLVPTYPVMLASPYEEKSMLKMQYPALAQLKLDGMRFNAIVENGKVEFRSRNGKQIDLLGNLEEEFIELAKKISSETKTGNVVFDGELVVYDGDVIMNRQKGNGILNKAVKGTISTREAAMVHATIWDVIPVQSFKIGFFNKYYKDRFSMINVDTPDRIHVVESTIVNNEDEARELFEQYLAQGEEGIILKDGWGLWEDKRVKHQIKFKGELECDLLCVDWQEGTGKNMGRLGALVLQSSDGMIKVNVGTGFSDEQRDKYTKNNTVGKVVAVRYNARIQDKKTGEHSLFLPVFLELREDKDVADVSTAIK